MLKPSLIAKNILLLILGILLGSFFALYVSFQGKEYVTEEISSQERFKNKNEAKAFGLGEYDFYNKLSSRKVDYQEELSQLLKYGFSRETDDLNKLRLLFTQWGYDSPHYAMEALKNISVPAWFREDLSSHIFEGWAEKNPEELAEYYKADKKSLYQTKALSSAIKSWAQSDLNGALSFLTTLTIGEMKEGVESILLENKNANSEVYMKVLSHLPAQALEDGEFLKKIMSTWILSSPEEAMKWATTLPVDKQELFTKYKGLETLPPINSLMKEFGSNSTELFDTLKQYPEAMQVEAWSTVMKAVQDKEGDLAAVKWQLEHMPPEAIQGIAQAEIPEIFYAESGEDDPEVYEHLLDNYTLNPYDDVISDALRSVYFTYKDKFWARYPERVFSCMERLYGKETAAYIDSGELRAWVYDSPEEARKWMTKKVEELSSDFKQYMSDRLKDTNPVMAIEKDER